MGICGRKDELVDHYEKKLEDVEGNMRTEQLSAAGKVNIIITVAIGLVELNLFFLSGLSKLIIVFWRPLPVKIYFHRLSLRVTYAQRHQFRLRSLLKTYTRS